MLDFSFVSNTKLVFGRDSQTKIGALAKEHLGGRILLHFGGGSVRASGLLDEVTGSLLAAGAEVVPFGGAQPNPVLDLCVRGAALCREKQITGIVALGGGSAIDSAKCIALAARYDGDPWDFYEGKQPDSALPLGVVLTIPAAGSETSPNSVVTNEAKGIKRGVKSDLIRPVFSILNPELTFTLPPFQTACGIADIFAHVLERYFTRTPHVEATDRLCEGVMAALVTEGPKCIADPRDYEARANVLFLGAFAHNGFLNLGRVDDWGTHAMSHELSVLYNATHGAALSVLFPAWMKYVYKSDPGRFARFAKRVFDIEGITDPEQLALAGIARFEAYLKSLGLPVRLQEMGIDGSRNHEIAERVVAFGPRGNFLVLTAEHVRNILELAMKP